MRSNAKRKEKKKEKEKAKKKEKSPNRSSKRGRSKHSNKVTKAQRTASPGDSTYVPTSPSSVVSSSASPRQTRSVTRFNKKEPRDVETSPSAARNDCSNDSTEPLCPTSPSNSHQDDDGIGTSQCHLLASDTPITEPNFYTPWASEEEEKRWFHPSFMPQCRENIGDTVWNELDIAVVGLASFMVANGLPWQSLDTSTQTTLTAFCPKAALISGSGFLALLQSWIWHIIYDNLLSPDNMDKWIGEEWRGFGILQRALRGKSIFTSLVFYSTRLHPNVHSQSFRLSNPTLNTGHRETPDDNYYNFMNEQTRTNACSLLYMIYGQHTDPTRLSNIILETIAPVIGIAHDEADEGIDRDDWERLVESHVIEIAKLAARVDFAIQASPVKIDVKMHHPATGQIHGFPYDPKLMSSSSPSWKFHSSKTIGNRVGLLMSPFIRFWGTASPRPDYSDDTLTDIAPQTVRHFNEYDMQLATVYVEDEPTDDKLEESQNSSVTVEVAGTSEPES